LEGTDRSFDINGVAVLSEEHATRLIDATPKGGEISITVSGFYHFAHKRHRNQYSGVKFQDIRYEGESCVAVCHVDTKNGLFPHLRDGQIILSVNQQKVTSAERADHLIRTKRNITLVVMDPHTADDHVPQPFFADFQDQRRALPDVDRSTHIQVQANVGPSEVQYNRSMDTSTISSLKDYHSHAEIPGGNSSQSNKGSDDESSVHTSQAGNMSCQGLAQNSSSEHNTIDKTESDTNSGIIEEELNEIINEGLKLLGIARRKTESVGHSTSSRRRLEAEQEVRDYSSKASRLFLLASRKAEDAMVVQRKNLQESVGDASIDLSIKNEGAKKAALGISDDSFDVDQTLSTKSMETFLSAPDFGKEHVQDGHLLDCDEDISAIEVENQLLELSQSTPPRSRCSKGPKEEEKRDLDSSPESSEYLGFYEDQTSQVSALFFDSPTTRTRDPRTIHVSDDSMFSPPTAPKINTIDGPSRTQTKGDVNEELFHILHYLDEKMMELAFISVDAEQLQSNQRDMSRSSEALLNEKIRELEFRARRVMASDVPSHRGFQDPSLDWLLGAEKKDGEDDSRIHMLQTALADREAELVEQKKQWHLCQQEIRGLKYEVLQKTWEGVRSKITRFEI